ncbi:glyoxalase/bleomycin resistance protein/dioxygenase [Mycobacteroides abscessus subsp. abscessus]|nr:glyoxalase/bleomycin resistance protein/dioxygenase [Mycobacteroides abscessus subsp. abscessus]
MNWPEGTGGIMLGSHRPGGEWALEPGTAGAYVVTRDPDGLYQRIVAKKADIVRPLAKTDYGAHEFAVRDPEGNLWSFGDYTGEPAPE